jgi:hypothetical protein
MTVPLINVGDIIRRHFRTLREDAVISYLVFYFLIIPLIFATICVWFQKFVTENIANSLLTAFSIFIGLLLNIILVIFAIVDNSGRGGRLSTLKIKLLEHLYSNSIYTLLLSTIIVVFLIVMLILNDWYSFPLITILSFIVYFGLFHFIMTLLMIFKRLYVLLFE